MCYYLHIYCICPSDGVPKISVDFWGERRHMSHNDARVIHCDLVAERERQKPLMLLDRSIVIGSENI